MIRTAWPVMMGVLLVGLSAGEARAQLSLGAFDGYLTGHLGGTTGGTVSGGARTFGLSIAVAEDVGWGAEFDFGRASGDERLSGEADVQTYMMSLFGVLPTGKLRPFFVAGAGGLRVHACDTGCGRTLTWTDWGLSAGGGGFYRFNSIAGIRGDVRYFTALQEHPDPARPESFNFWRVSIGATFLWNLVP